MTAYRNRKAVTMKHKKAYHDKGSETDMNKMLRKKLLPLLLAFSLILPPVTGSPKKAEAGTIPNEQGGNSNTMEISLTIKGTISNESIAFDTNTFEYNGTVKKPTVTVTYVYAAGQNQTLVESTDYTVSIKDSSGNVVTEPKNAGTYTVAVTAKDGSCFTGSGTKIYTITKATPSAPAAPTRAGSTKNSITLTAHDGYQYSKDGTIWQDSPTFTGLSPGTEYSFYQRVKGTVNTEESPASAAAKFSTDADTYAMTITLVIAKKERTAPDVSKLAVTNPATVKSADGKIEVGTSGLTAGDLAYSKDDGKTWTNVSAFPITGLSAGVYCFKYKENDTYKESEKSKGVVLEPVNVLSQVTLSGSTVYNSGEDSVLTAKTNSNVAGLSLSYKWYRDDKEISGQTGDAYTLTSADVGTIIKVVVTDSVGENSVSTAIPEKIATTAPAGYKISGIVRDSGNNGLGSAKVELKKGDYVVAETDTSESGEYSFEKIPAGQYNVVVTESGSEKVKTAIATITSSDVTIDTIKMPEKNVSSKLIVENNDDSGLAGGAVVGGLDDVAEAQAANVADGAATTVTMTVESEKDLTSVADGSLTEEQKETKEAQADIKENTTAQSLEKLDFLDLSIIMRVKVEGQETTQSEITDTGSKVLEIILPYQTSGRKNITAFRKHGTKAAAALSKLSSRPTANFSDGTFFIGTGFIVIYSSSFSTYAIGYSADNGSGGGSGGGGGYVPYITPTVSPSPSPSASPSVSPSPSASAEVSASPTASVEPSASIIPSAVPSASTAPSVSASPSASVAPSVEPSASIVPSAVPSASTAPTASVAPSASAALAVSASPSASAAPTKAPADKVTKAEKAQAKLDLNAGLKVSRTSSKVTVKWGKVKKTDRYDIYAAYCGKDNKCEKVLTVSGRKKKAVIKKLNGEQLKRQKDIKVYVVAYRKVNGKETKLAKSITGHVVGDKNTKYTNAKSIKLKKTKYSMKAGKTKTVKAELALEDKRKKALPKSHVATFRYASSNTKVAKVDKNGKITAVGKGTCYIYVYAANGLAKKVKVTVK